MATDPLAPALRLAGFALAHAVGCVEDGETLCTMAMVEDAGGDRDVVRFEAPTIPESLEVAFHDLAPRLREGDHAVVIFDGYVTPEGGARTDALVATIVTNGGTVVGRIVQPYRPAKRSRLPFGRATGFALLGPPAASDELGPEADAILLRAAREHEKAARHFPDAAA